MAAAACSAEAQGKVMPSEVVKPWLGSSPQAGKLQAAMMRAQENPYAKFAHLKALADSRGLGDVYKRQIDKFTREPCICPHVRS